MLRYLTKILTTGTDAWRYSRLIMDWLCLRHLQSVSNNGERPTPRVVARRQGAVAGNRAWMRGRVSIKQRVGGLEYRRREPKIASLSRSMIS